MFRRFVLSSGGLSIVYEVCIVFSLGGLFIVYEVCIVVHEICIVFCRFVLCLGGLYCVQCVLNFCLNV